MAGFGADWSWCAVLDVPMGDARLTDRLPFGAVVAVANLVACVPTGNLTLGVLEESRRRRDRPYGWTERMLGDYELGRYGWVLESVRPLAQPVPCRGAQGLFEIPDQLVEGVKR